MLATLFLLAFVGPVPSRQCDLWVRVIDVDTGKALPKIAVNLRIGVGDRKTVQQETDSTGTTCFAIPALVEQWTSVDALSLRYHSIHADPLIRHLPEQVTIPMKHLSLLESLRYLYEGD